MSLFNLNKGTTVAVLAFVAIFGLGLGLARCHAATTIDPPYVQLSAGGAVVRGYAPVLDLTFAEPASVLKNSYWQQSLAIIGTSSYNGVRVPNNFALRALFVDGFGRLDLGLGVSWMQNYLPYNGSPVNFNLQASYRFENGFTLTYTHMSNAGSRLPNLGRDLFLIGYRFH